MKLNQIFKELTAELKKNSVCASGIAESVDTFLIHDIYESEKSRLCVVLAQDSKSAERICNELNSIEANSALLFPQANNIPYNMRSVFGPTREQRMVVLNDILDGNAKIVVMPFATIFEKVASPEKLFNSVLSVAVGEDVSPDILAQKLTNAGFSRESMITAPGQYSKRGGIFDIYAFGHENPIRIEFWGDTIDSIREFDIFKQRSIKPVSKINILPMKEFSPSVEERDLALVKIKEYCEKEGIDKKSYDFIAHSWSVFNEIDGLEWFSHWFDLEQGSIFDYFPENSLIIHNDVFDLERIFEREIGNYENHKGRVPEVVAPFASNPQDLLVDVSQIRQKLQFRQCFLNQKSPSFPNFTFDFANQPPFLGDFSLFVNDLNYKYEMGFDVKIFAENEGHANRLREMLEEKQLKKIPPIETLFLQNGFFSLSQKIYCYCDRKIFDRAASKKVAQKLAKRASAVNFDTLERGDIVVHIDHGIGKYLGVDKVKVGDFEQDCLLIEYRDKAFLRVPIIDYYKVQKYIGKDGFAPELSVLGSSAWQKRKERTREQLQEMAGKMVKLYAKREVNDGLICAADNNWQKEFEASFEYEPTDDQITVIEQIKKDLCDKKPMDRLVCGDVGFGKTEVAMRAAFKAVMSGFQVAVLAPTTVLAAQHTKTFRERMAEFPVKIQDLSRLTEGRSVGDIKDRVAKGEIDILVGTHKILAKDVEFKNLGLLIIDEEQRFGVKQKDSFTNFRQSIDDLSMSATPIPRTLHMSMAGIRD